jgi:hypothetical protein
MSYTVPPETMLPSSITEARLCKGPVAARPDGKPASSIFKLQVKNSQGRPQDIQLQVSFWLPSTDEGGRRSRAINSHTAGQRQHRQWHPRLGQFDVQV